MISEADTRLCIFVSRWFRSFVPAHSPPHTGGRYCSCRSNFWVRISQTNAETRAVLGESHGLESLRRTVKAPSDVASSPRKRHALVPGAVESRQLSAPERSGTGLPAPRPAPLHSHRLRGGGRRPEAGARTLSLRPARGSGSGLRGGAVRGLRGGRWGPLAPRAAIGRGAAPAPRRPGPRL